MVFCIVFSGSIEVLAGPGGIGVDTNSVKREFTITSPTKLNVNNSGASVLGSPGGAIVGKYITEDKQNI
ncbi:hypothetical protein [Bacillus horti]|uniref:hypothetical protein n=1 Tax=Caldalkalibacillus horti TaxID=77523 RepID=UPI0031DFD358